MHLLTIQAPGRRSPASSAIKLSTKVWPLSQFTKYFQSLGYLSLNTKGSNTRSIVLFFIKGHFPPVIPFSCSLTYWRTTRWPYLWWITKITWRSTSGTLTVRRSGTARSARTSSPPGRGWRSTSMPNMSTPPVKSVGHWSRGSTTWSDTNQSSMIQRYDDTKGAPCTMGSFMA